jgi:electron transfer flavoprotein alpha/beta subunit
VTPHSERLRIAICLKAAWRTDVPLRLADAGASLRPDGAEPALAPADAGALATALALRARWASSGAEAPRLLALTVGPPVGEGVLRDALAAGVDEVLRIWPEAWSDTPAPESDGSAARTRVRALLAAEVLRLDASAGQPYGSAAATLTHGSAEASRPPLAQGPLLVLTGAASPDEGHGAFGAFLAHALGLPFAHRATRLDPAPGGWTSGWAALVKLERGYTQELMLERSAVVTWAGPSQRLPEASWPAWLASRTAPIPVLRPALPREAEGAPAATTALRAPVPRVKHAPVPDSSLSAEQRIRALLGAPAQASGSLLPASEGVERQVDAALALLEARGYVAARKS